jgi:hypothetical protein
MHMMPSERMNTMYTGDRQGRKCTVTEDTREINNYTEVKNIFLRKEDK